MIQREDSNKHYTEGSNNMIQREDSNKHDTEGSNKQDTAGFK